MGGFIEGAVVWLGLKWGSVVAGFFGALASLRIVPGATRSQKIGNFLFGWGAAAFMTPWLAELILPKESVEKHLGGMGFLIGMLALSIVMRFVEAVPDWLAGARQIVMGVAGRYFGAKPEGSKNGTADR
jgi:hypothetical protein